MTQKQKNKTAGVSKEKSLDWSLFSTYRTEIMGVACILVFLFHFADLLSDKTIYWENPFLRFIGIGNVGVDIFLVASGIGLYYSYSKSNKAFYRKRIIRIMVPYVLICIPFYAWKDLITQIDGRQFIKDVTQYSFVTEGMRTTWYMPAITIFYLAFPLIYHMIFDNHRIAADSACVLICIFFIWINVILSRHSKEIYPNIEIMLTRIVAFVIGIYYGSVVNEKKPIKTSQILAAIAFIYFYTIVFRKEQGLATLWTRLFYVVLAISIVLVCTAYLHKRGHSAFLCFFGKRSLEIYLYHVIFRIIYFFYFDGNIKYYYIPDYILILTVSILVSVIAHIIINKISTELLVFVK